MLKTNAVVIVSLLFLSACGVLDRRADNTSNIRSQTSIYSGVGTVTAVDIVKGNDPGLVGALIGAIGGGVLGSQIGDGRGKTLATIAGTVGGAVAGREVQRRYASNDDVHKVTVLMENGSYQTIAMDSNPELSVGNRVRIADGQVYRYPS